MKKSKKDKALGILLGVLVGLLIVGFFALLDHSGNHLVGTENRATFNDLVIIYLAIVGMYLFHIAIHELGHLVFGRLTGYRFLSYRFLSFGITRKNEDLQFFRMYVPGQAGQAMMEPPCVENGKKKPYFWCNIGGVLVNFVAGVIFTWISITTSNPTVYMISLVGAGTGMLAVLLNGIPYSTQGITDGCNILQFYKYPERLDIFYKQLEVVGALSRGKTWSEFSPEEFKAEGAPDNAFAMIPRLYQINTLYARKEFVKAGEVLATVKPYQDKVTKLYGNMIQLEEMFLELIGENDSEKIETLYTKKIKQFAKAMKYEASMWRIRMAYAWFYEEDKEEAMECYKKIQKLREKTMYTGDVELELFLAQYILERMEQTDVLHLE